MPFYDYRCATCGKEQTVSQMMEAQEAPICNETEPTDDFMLLRIVSTHGPMVKQLTASHAFTFTRGKGTSGGNSMRMPSKSRS